MSKVSLADLIHDWKQLLKAAKKYGDQKDLHVQLQKLEAAIQQFVELEALRARLQAQRQEATQKLEHVKKAGKDAAMETRQTLKAILGVRSELLVEFNIRPRRSRRVIVALPPAPVVDTPES